MNDPRTRVLLALALLVSLGGAGGYVYQRLHPNTATYPVFDRVPGAVASPLWTMSPEAIDRATLDDAARLKTFIDSLDRAVANLRAQDAVIDHAHPELLSMATRQSLRDAWADVLEPLLAIDALKQRYEGWYGISYLARPTLHARAFAIELASLCAQAIAGHAVVERLNTHPAAQRILDEANAGRQIPSNTFTAMRAGLTRTRDFSYVPVGARWFDLWIDRHLRDAPDHPLREIVRSRRERALQSLGARDAVTTAESRLQTVQRQAFQRWFPVQTEVATWAGDTRVAPENRRLISDAQLDAMRAQMRPGDIIVERRNWYLSNVGLPGFWPHAVLFVGTPDELRATYDALPEVTAAFGMPFTQYLSTHHPDVWRALSGSDPHGRPHRVLEAVSEGVVTSSLEHSCGADYVGVLRPTFGPVVSARAIEKAFGLYGRPYDFNFDFATDDQIVCSELVLKAYEPVGPTAPGLRVPPIQVAGRSAIPPTEFVRLFQHERATPSPQLEFVYFLDGREREHRALVADAEALAATLIRPKWDIAQP